MLFRSIKGLKRWFACAAAACWLGAAPPAHAGDQEDVKTLLQRLEKLEKQNEELKKRVQEIEYPVIQDKAGAIAPGAGSELTSFRPAQEIRGRGLTSFQPPPTPLRFVSKEFRWRSRS